MQKALILFFMAGLSYTAHAQFAYHGGSGDGHAMAELKNVIVQHVDDHELIKYKIYPNPCNHQDGFTVSIDGTELSSLTLIAADGKLVLEKKVSGSHNIALNDLAPGIYILEIRRSSSLVRERIIIR
jgi:hypothetical protein